MILLSLIGIGSTRPDFKIIIHFPGMWPKISEKPMIPDDESKESVEPVEPESKESVESVEPVKPVTPKIYGNPGVPGNPGMPGKPAITGPKESGMDYRAWKRYREMQ